MDFERLSRTVAAERAAIFGATGATGRSLARELVGRGRRVRCVSRSRANLWQDFGHMDVERHVADLSDETEAIRAASESDVIYHCVGLSLSHFHRHPAIARNAVRAAEEAGARLLLVSSFWSYGPEAEVPVAEDARETGGGGGADPGRCLRCGVRREQEEEVLRAGGAVAVLPDFYGPGAETSLLNDGLTAAWEGETVYWPGDADEARSFLFVPDSGPVLCDLAEREEAYGRRWNVAGFGPAVPSEVLRRAARLAGRELKIREVGTWALRIGGLFRREVRGFSDVLPLYDRSYVLDGTRLDSLLGGVEWTSYDRGIRRLLTGASGP